ncbi:hypothetical protein BDF22DRAFT_740635 [Syncephalis plumigaleata]|nr:hypothetical protein BDF22DRAFT_740635 [Syncephalis plumigaleata]
MSVPHASTQHSRTIADRRLHYESKRWDLICVGVIMPLTRSPSICCQYNALHEAEHTELSSWVNLATIILIIAHIAFSIAAYVVYAAFHKREVATHHIRYNSEYILGIMETSMSGVIAALLIYDFYLAKRAKHPGISLTRREFRLVKTVTHMIIWWAISSVVFMYLEHWTYLQGIYFWIVSMTTIGFGDHKPTYLASRLTWVAFDIVSLGLLTRMINAYVVVVFENIEMHTEHRIQELRRSRRHHRRMSEVQLTGTNGPDSDSISDITLAEDIGQTVADARKEKSSEQGKEVIEKVTFATLLLMSCWLFGALAFSRTEGWDFGTSFYFTFVSLTTTGFGDVTVRSATGIVIFIFFCLVGVGCTAYFGSVLAQMRFWILRYAIRRGIIHMGEGIDYVLRFCYRVIRCVYCRTTMRNVIADTESEISNMPTARTLRRLLPPAMTAATFSGPMPADESIMPISEREAVVEEILDATRKLNRTIHLMSRFLVKPQPVTAQRQLTRVPHLIDNQTALTESPLESPELMASPPPPPPPPPSTPRLLMDERRRSLAPLHEHPGVTTTTATHPEGQQMPSRVTREMASLTVMESLPIWQECRQHMRNITRATVRLLDIERDAR